MKVLKLLFILGLMAVSSVGASAFDRTSALELIQSEVQKGDDMNLLTIHVTLEQVGIDLKENWDPDYYKKIVHLYPEIFKRMVHHGTVESIAPFYRERQGEIDRIVKKTLSKKDREQFHLRMKASLQELEHGQD